MPGALQRRREHDALVARVGGNVDRRGRGVVAGIENAVPSGRTPCAELRLSLPMASAASSTATDVKPQA